MFDDNDPELGPVLTLVIGLAIVVCLLTIGVALAAAGVFSTASPTTARIDAANPIAPIRILFPVGSAALPDDAANALFTVVVAATVDAGRRVELSGHHDASGDRATHRALAKARAEAVRDALKAAGLADARIVLQKPVEVTDGSDPAQTRRVDVTLR